MNETLELLINRASCRAFKNKKIPAAVLNNILEAGVHVEKVPGTFCVYL